uniref:Odorant binding protein 2 n=1 Tax=Tomicus yunnanensis TaxID=768153 RepID=A0A4P2HIY5_9CUCU|nr:odorant binding protein 2 [Tomicus yunnanensis]
MFLGIKCILALALLMTAANADQRQKVVDFHRPCLDNHGVEDEDLTKALDYGQIRDDDDFYLHFFCVAKRANVMSDDGVVNTDNFENDMKGIIDDHNMENVAAIVRHCLIQKSTVLETIRDAVNCFLGKDHKL